MVQTKLQNKEYKLNLSKPYSKGPYNKYNKVEQWIRISEGCPNNCDFCRETKENGYKPIYYDLPKIVRNNVKIMDMNLLYKPRALRILKELGSKRVGGKVVYYELVCGIDYRFMNKDLATALKENRFINIRLAWDHSIKEQMKIKDCINLLLKAGYQARDITIFMICNWKTTYKDNCLKLDLCKVWGVKAADCYYDNQLSPNIKPIYWDHKQIRKFRARVRKHNQLVRFGIDPEIK